MKNMLSSDKGEDELFFDSVDSMSFEQSNVTREGLGSSRSNYEMWLNEPQSVQERRQSFLQGMGFRDFASKSDQIIGSQRITECSGAVSSSSVSFTSEKEEILIHCGRDQNCETNSIVDEMDQDRLFSPNEACKNDGHVCSPHLQGFINSEVEEHKNLGAGKKKMKSWWKHFVNKRKDRLACVSKQSKANPGATKVSKIKVKQNKKNCMEFTGVYMAQKIQAHTGLIRTMKFSPGGQYLATGGEDGVVRIWRVTSMDASCKSFTSEGHFASNLKDKKSVFNAKKISKASVIIPDKVFQIEESPLQEFHGHVSGVLDLAWSNSHYLLSASADKTVRLWKVGCNHCLNVFQHSDYVTCIQFNPVDETYFISGSIDGKVRIWGVSEKRVVDWADIRDVISAICYRPDGKGFVVGCITGSCRFYDVSGSYLQLEAEVNFCGRRKTSGNSITGIQSVDERSQRVMVTSEDSKIRIFDGVDIIAKFKGLPRSGSQMSASLTSTGRHIVSVGEDCHVYVWNYDGLGAPSSKHTKSAQSFEHFLVEGVSVALPWSGMGKDLTGLRGGRIWGHKQRDDCASYRRDSERFSLGNWLFMDGPCRRSSATWPEEKLPLWGVSIAENGCYNQHHGCLQRQVNNANDHHAALSDAWDLVIVTAGCDGTLKTFHNYGLPIRL